MDYYLFLTNIYKDKATHIIENLLKHYFKVKSVDFEINNKKSIMRIQGHELSPLKIQSTINGLGYNCTGIQKDDQ
ncbi:MAG: hypothetical protein H6582_05925 [Crocinitomicaceae bacterium]|nr:hypothetical protein [Crocinitomicaceae bacterium]